MHDRSRDRYFLEPAAIVPAPRSLVFFSREVKKRARRMTQRRQPRRSGLPGAGNGRVSLARFAPAVDPLAVCVGQVQRAENGSATIGSSSIGMSSACLPVSFSASKVRVRPAVATSQPKAAWRSNCGPDNNAVQRQSIASSRRPFTQRPCQIRVYACAQLRGGPEGDGAAGAIRFRRDDVR